MTWLLPVIAILVFAVAAAIMAAALIDHTRRLAVLENAAAGVTLAERLSAGHVVGVDRRGWYSVCRDQTGDRWHVYDDGRFVRITNEVPRSDRYDPS